MAVVKWQFFDPATTELYTFPVNPSDGGSPGFRRQFTYESTAHPDGQTIVFQGREEVPSLEFSGVLLTEAEYLAFVSWYANANQIVVTDDLGRQFTAIFESFDPRRERAAHYPWKHSYSASFKVVGPIV